MLPKIHNLVPKRVKVDDLWWYLKAYVAQLGKNMDDRIYLVGRQDGPVLPFVSGLTTAFSARWLFVFSNFAAITKTIAGRRFVGI